VLETRRERRQSDIVFKPSVTMRIKNATKHAGPTCFMCTHINRVNKSQG
jgi:hypothetical protein